MRILSRYLCMHVRVRVHEHACVYHPHPNFLQRCVDAYSVWLLTWSPRAKGAAGSAVFQHIIEEGYGELNGDKDFPGHGYQWESGLPAIVAAAARGEEGKDANGRLLEHHHRRKFGAPPPVGTSPPVNSSNIDRLSFDLVNRAKNNTQWFQATNASSHTNSSRGATIMLPWGSDWSFSEDAHINFKNMDLIVAYINNHSAEWGATIRYGTLDKYLDTVHGNGGAADGAPSSLALPVVDGDFMVMDEQCCQKTPELKLWNCWSGYYSTFPTLKRLLRVLEGTLRHAEMLAILAAGKPDGPSSSSSDGSVSRWEAALGWGRHTAAILQHHDAITGTGGPACNVEYIQMLVNATFLCEQVIANTTSVLLGLEPNALQYYRTAAAPSAQPPSPPAPPWHPPKGKTCSTQVRLRTQACLPHTSHEPTDCNALGCCWDSSTDPNKFPWCFLPQNNSTPEATPLSSSGSRLSAPPPSPLDVGKSTVLQLPPFDGFDAGATAAMPLSIPIVAANSLGWNRTDVIVVVVNASSSAMNVLDQNGRPVPSQLAPTIPQNTSMADDEGGHAGRHVAWRNWATSASPASWQLSRLFFTAPLPGLGAATFYITASDPAGAAGGSANAAVSAIHVGDGKVGFTLENEALAFTASPSGLLETVLSKAAGQGPKAAQEELELRQDFMLYWGNGGNRARGSGPDGTGGDGGSQSDAYVFSPQGPASSVVGRSDTGYWPATSSPKPVAVASVVHITGPLVNELSTVHSLGKKMQGTKWAGPRFWQATRLFQSNGANDSGVGMESAETAYLVDPLYSNTDLVARYSTGGRCTAATIYTDAAGWTTTATARKLNFFDLQGKIGCNFLPSSSFAEIRGSSGDFSIACINDRARGVASLADGQLEYVLHRHATGGDGRGPTDDDGGGVLGVVDLLPATSHSAMLKAQMLRPEIALRRSHPVSLLFGAPTSAPPMQLPGTVRTSSRTWSPLSAPLPHGVHLLSFQRRSFLKAGSHVPAYPGGNLLQGTLRLQHVYSKDSGSPDATVDASTLFARDAFILHEPLTERTLSLARPITDVKRRSWRGVGMSEAVLTAPRWSPGDAGNSSALVNLAPTQIRSYTFNISS